MCRCCSAIRPGSATSWAGRRLVPLEQTLDDILDYWRAAQCDEGYDERTYGETRASFRPSIWPHSRSCSTSAPAKPTTRAIADLVKRGGTAALTEAEARADQARYQEVTCRSALNRVEGMPFNWTLNPYRGCTHGCHYCFARRYHVQFEMNADDEFASVILVKHNIVDVLARELDRPSWTREQVAVGTATDPYQPIEGHYKLTRGAIQALARGRTPIGLVTKGPMVVRDIDVLGEHVARRRLHGLHERADRRRGCVADARARHGAPASAAARGPRARRRRHQRRRADGADRSRVSRRPASKLERTIKAIADHGARFVGCNVMYLQDGTRTHFMNFIEPRVPGDGAAVREAVREEISAGRLSQGSAGDGAGAAGALRAEQTRTERRATNRPTRRNRNRSASQDSDCRFRIAG